MTRITRRTFVTSVSAGIAAAARPAYGQAPTVLTRRTVRPVVISDLSGARFRNGGPQNCVEKAFSMIAGGADVLDALVAGVNIPELDPEETGVGYGGLPNAAGVVQLDACCMHGPRKQAGGVAALEGVRTPSLVAKAVMEHTDHHLLVGKGAQDFARAMGSASRRTSTPTDRAGSGSSGSAGAIPSITSIRSGAAVSMRATGATRAIVPVSRWSGRGSFRKAASGARSTATESGRTATSAV